MFNKYKIKKRKKLLNPYYIFIAFIISLFFVSYGYALFSDNLKIKGTANILDNSDGSNIVYGNSTYSWSLFSSWAAPDNGFVYQIEFPITNLDGDIDKWEVSFDVPEGCIATTSEIWQASQVSVSGNTVTIIANDWNAFVENGSVLALNLILPFKSPVDFNVSNVILNGKGVNYVPTT